MHDLSTLRRLNKDRVSAGILVVLGVAITGAGLTYRMGTLTRMGAGFIPVVLGTLLAMVGVAIGVTAEPGDFGTAQSMPMEWRGWLCVLGGILAFALLGVYGGMVPATFFSVLIAALGDRANSLRDALLLALAITVTGVLIFVYGLKMTFPLFTWG